MAKDMHSINLLPNKGQGFTDQFLVWALSIGRLLIILIETLALSVFLYRFSIDRKIIDLNDEIKKQSAIVAQFKNTEDTARNLHERLDLAKKTQEETDATTSLFSDIIEMGRGKVTFGNVLVSNQLVKIELQSKSSSALNTFVNSLKTHPDIRAVSIDNLENKITSAAIFMSITAELEGSVDELSDSESVESIPDPANINP